MGDEVIKIGGRVDMGCLLPERHAPAHGGKEIPEHPLLPSKPALSPIAPADQAIAVAVNAIEHAVDGIHIDGRGLRHLQRGGGGV